jgi:iron complex outermembrane recepter protein
MNRLPLVMVLWGTASLALAQTAPSQSQSQGPEQLQEVVVTGTLIRGTPPVGSQLITLDNADVVATGATNTADLLATVPQVASFNSFPQGGAVTSDSTGASAPSLHALPPEATLVLMNGHRLVGDSPLSTVPDPSNIPPAAIERIEVVADGGSAIYGSDAVAGVINIILKQNFEGAETDVSYGGASSYNTANIGQTFGHVWSNGSAMISAFYANNSDLLNGDRSFYTANLVPYGGQDFRVTSCSPPNVMIGSTTYFPPGLLAGPAALCDTGIGAGMIDQYRRWGAVATVRQEVNDNVQLFMDAKYTNAASLEPEAPNLVPSSTITSANPFFVAPPGTGATSETILYNTGNLGTQNSTFTNDSGNVAVGADIKLPRDWHLNTTLNYGSSKASADDASYNGTLLQNALAATTPSTALDPFGDHTNPAVAAAILNYYGDFDSEQKLYDVNVKTDGTVLKLPGGNLKVALGGAWRKETFDATSTEGVPSEPGYTFVGVSTDRNVGSGFGQIDLPVFGPDNAVPMLHSLNLSAAVRYDHYSDFGSTTNPKYGLSWDPVDGISFRASYGHSFHAPQLSDLDAVDSRAIFFPSFPLVPPGSGPLNTIVLAGGNPNLQPETARTASFGVDFSPALLRGFGGSLTYFLIRYTNQIQVAPISEQVFLNPTLYHLFVTENPTQAQLNALYTSGIPLTFTLPLNAPVNQIIDFRRNNIGSTSLDGWDFDLHYQTNVAHGTVKFGVQGEYLLEYETIQAPGSPPVDNLTSGASYINGLGIIPWHVRGTVEYAETSWRTQVAVNYSGDYKFGYVNTAGTPAIQDVKSFTTVNWFTSWDLPLQGLGRNTTAQLNVYNIFDQNPPLLLQSGGFSAATANPLGRMIMLTLSKHW